MKRKTSTHNEDGLTLVEILASLVILGIVFVSFMTIFPQMSLFNERTETKLETMNEARIVLEEYKTKTLKTSQLDRFDNNVCVDSDKNDWTSLNYVDSLQDNRTVIVSVKNCPDVKKPVLASENTDKDRVVQLHQLHVEIKSEKDLFSESFGYVKVE